MPEPQAQSDPSTPDSFSKLRGIWAQIAGLGITGFACLLSWYLAIYTIPTMQDKHAVQMEKAREEFRQELKAEREIANKRSELANEHGTTAVKNLSGAINELTRMMDSRQSQLIYLQTKAIEDKK